MQSFAERSGELVAAATHPQASQTPHTQLEPTRRRERKRFQRRMPPLTVRRANGHRMTAAGHRGLPVARAPLEPTPRRKRKRLLSSDLDLMSSPSNGSRFEIFQKKFSSSAPSSETSGGGRVGRRRRDDGRPSRRGLATRWRRFRFYNPSTRTPISRRLQITKSERIPWSLRLSRPHFVNRCASARRSDSETFRTLSCPVPERSPMFRLAAPAISPFDEGRSGAGRPG